MAALPACEPSSDKLTTAAPQDPITWTGDVAADSNRIKVLAYADALEWDLRRDRGDSGVVDSASGAEAVIVPNKKARQYDAQDLRQGRFIARIRPIRGTYERLGMVDGDASHIYVWVQVAAAPDTAQPAMLIFESRRGGKVMRVVARPRNTGPHATVADDDARVAWTPLRTAAAPGAPPPGAAPGARRGAAVPADPRGFAPSLASIDWFSAARRLIAALARPRLEPRQGGQFVPWGDCSQYCCEVN